MTSPYDAAAIAASLHTDTPIAVRARELLARWRVPNAAARYGLGVTAERSTTGHLVVPIADQHGSPRMLHLRALRDTARCRACREPVTALVMSERARSGAADWRTCPHCGASNNRARLAWLVGQHPRWIAAAGSEHGRALYGAERGFSRAGETGVLHLVEGPRDAWALDEIDRAAVALLGAYLSDRHLEILENLPRSTRIRLCTDDDRLGHKAAAINAERLSHLGFQCERVSGWHGAKDPAGLLARDGTAALGARLRGR